MFVNVIFLYNIKRRNCYQKNNQNQFPRFYFFPQNQQRNAVID